MNNERDCENEKLFVALGDGVMVRRATAICPRCNGELEYTGIMMYTDPPRYEHKCKSCGYITGLDKTYPCFVEVDENSTPLGILLQVEH